MVLPVAAAPAADRWRRWWSWVAGAGGEAGLTAAGRGQPLTILMYHIHLHPFIVVSVVDTR